jgi:hypothetical protein
MQITDNGALTEDKYVRAGSDRQQESQVSAVHASRWASSDNRIDRASAREEAQECFFVGQNEPRPFDASTRIGFGFTRGAQAKVIVYKVNGALVRTVLDSRLEKGTHVVEWDGKDDSGNYVQSGSYLCRLYADTNSTFEKIEYLR